MHVLLCYLDVIIVYNVLFQQEHSVLSLFAERFYCDHYSLEVRC